MATLTPEDVIQRTADELIPLWSAEKRKLDRIDKWARWDHDKPHKPRNSSPEYKELAARAQAPWGDLIVRSSVQMLYMDGYRRPSDPKDSRAWRMIKANKLDGRQVAIYTAAITYGLAYGLGMPGTHPLTKEPMPVLRGVSPREMLALYSDVAFDDWPEIGIRVVKVKAGYDLHVYDDTLEHHLTLGQLGEKPKYVKGDEVEHATGRPPIVRWANRFDLEGRAVGEIEPLIPLLGRIDQTVFDRLVVQRFSSWLVRTIAGMDLSKMTKDEETPDQVKLKLAIEDFLVALNPETKFGSLPATPMEGFIAAHDDDLQVLASTSQTAANEILGVAPNLSAEAIAATKAGQTAKGDGFKQAFGPSNAQFVQLGAHQAGWADIASDFEAEVRWRDTSIRSLAQAVDAYGKAVTMMGFPARVLWPKIPGLTPADVDEAKQFADTADRTVALLGSLAGQLTPGTVPPAPVDLTKRPPEPIAA